MLTEGLVSIMALIAACTMLPGDYFAINLTPDAFAKLGLTTTNLAALEHMTGETLAGRPGGAVSLAAGMSLILSSIKGMNHLLGYWYHFAIMFEALFILTTIDAGTRVARYICQELAGCVDPQLGQNTWTSTIITGALVSLAWGYLVYNGEISTIWPLFGVANQLLATLALFVGTIFILKRSAKHSYALVTFLPGLFMLATTVTAAIQNIFENYLPKHSLQGNLNAGLSAIMLILVLIITLEASQEAVKVLTRRS